MEGIPAIYNGKVVSKKNFRVFIYSPVGDQRLVESWDEYEKAMESGIWFSSKADFVVPEEKTIEKLSRKKANKQQVNIAEDDFLSKSE